MGTPTVRYLVRPLLFALLVALSPASQACDSDAECGPGGTCIKREKRARGVCYGGQLDTPASRDLPAAGSPQAVDGELRERAKAWLGDPEQLINEQLPGQEVGETCMVSQDCDAGFECVVAGFEGRCVRF